ncbi:PAS domain-containing sensor histidine kinase [Tumebacillus permanentifrigoris]|uniref:Sensor histidine kinase n=1 Tax=Tumebacillus permanentifrigoris TaxID=378543 RepID=A0A316DBV3_9BACL|nr:PAS domain-containing sensor histidine kinase [Tumebacillus permanentifrigoris]PWK15671.1 two-component system sensor histidine kinase NreB [Tumebacillus permanentifrigoris]
MGFHMLDETAAFLETLFAHITDAILIVDAKGDVIGVNPAFERMTGWSGAELLGKKSLCELCRGMATCQEEASCIDCFASRLQTPSFQMHVVTKRGEEIAVAASSTRLPLEAGGQGALAVILRDTSDMQRIERERHQRQLTNYVIQAQEEERKRISRDLHDGIGQALYSIMVGLRVVNQLQIDEEIKHHLEEVQQLTARTMEEVKSLSVELRPSALDDLGLVAALRSYAKRFEQTFGILTHIEISGQRRRYHSTVETALYRICQEAMTNAAKYADTDQITLRFVDRADRVELEVEDAGIGFDPTQLQIRGTGLGLFGMRERVSLLGGTLTLTSAPQKGTKIHVEILVDEKGGPRYVHPTADRG